KDSLKQSNRSDGEGTTFEDTFITTEWDCKPQMVISSSLSTPVSEIVFDMGNSKYGFKVLTYPIGDAKSTFKVDEKQTVWTARSSLGYGNKPTSETSSSEAKRSVADFIDIDTESMKSGFVLITQQLPEGVATKLSDSRQEYPIEVRTKECPILVA